ncbi:hypothetical protein RHIZ_07355 [Rhizobium skierniewicense]|uniref:hypothetical protein n=1 Tax=Rhizobium skierniewicense TaxID=984260 RepID=UPI001FAC4B75|nr:hypothetical protein [Rhizobium skierniewicense]MCI9865755.1 hypothetical protein [Rhizobium skierniewicense]
MTFTSYWGCQPAAQTVVGPTAYLHCPQTSLYGCHTAVQHCPPAAEQGTPVGPTAYWHCPQTSLMGCQTAVQGCGLPTTAPQQQQNVTLTPVCQITNITPVCSTGIPFVCNGAAAYAAPQQQQQNVTLTPVCQITNITPVCSTGIPFVCNGAAANAAPQQQQQNVTLTPVCQITNITPVCSTGIPFVCNGAAAAQQATVTPATSIGCGTLATICNPTHMHCTGPGTATQPQNVTLTPVCQITNITPVCSTGIPFVCDGAAAYAAPQQASDRPVTSIGCGTLATICNPTHMHCTGQ